MLCVLRLLLGAVEAGIYPGVVYYLSTWFPDPYRIRMLGFFTLGSSLGNMIGGPINGTLLDLNGWLGLAGWQWVFIGGGLLALLLAVVVVALLPSSPTKARFLNEKDRQLLAAMHARRVQPPAPRKPVVGVVGSRVIGPGLIYIFLATSYYGMTYWLPTIIRDFGVSSTVNGFAECYSLGAGGAGPDRGAIAASGRQINLPLRGRGHPARRHLFPGQRPIDRQYATVCRARDRRPLHRGAQSVLLDLSVAIFYGARAAASIAAINAIGNIGGFFAPNLAPWVQHHTGSVAGPMLVPASCLIVLCAISSWLWLRAARQRG